MNMSAMITLIRQECSLSSENGTDYNRTCIEGIYHRNQPPSAEKDCNPFEDVVMHTEFSGRPCDEFKMELLKWAYPLLFLVSLIGNGFNIAVYRLPCFKGTAALHVLRMKAAANIGYVSFLIAEMIHSWTLGQKEADPFIEKVYWHSKPYTLYFANFFGALATWCTLFLSIQTLACVASPLEFQRLMKPIRVKFSLIFAFCLAASLHIFFPLCMVIKSDAKTLFRPNSSCIKSLNYFASVNSAYKVVEKPYFWTQALLVIIVPIIVMLVCSVMLIFKFPITELGQEFSQRRRCVLRLTFATTMAHLLLEGPGVIPIFFAAIHGSDEDRLYREVGSNYCYLPTITNCLGVINAAIPFYVYLVWNTKFRLMSLGLLASCFPFCCPNAERRIFLEQTIMNTNSRTAINQSRVRNSSMCLNSKSITTNTRATNDKSWHRASGSSVRRQERRDERRPFATASLNRRESESRRGQLLSTEWISLDRKDPPRSVSFRVSSPLVSTPTDNSHSIQHGD